LTFERVVVAVPTYSGHLRPECEASIAKLQGSWLMKVSGCSDVSQARSGLYTKVVRQFHAKADVMLCVDDDIAFSVDVAERVISRSLETGRAVSAVYGTNTGHICASRMAGPMFAPTGERLWLTGLGFTAVPMPLLVELARLLELVIMQDGTAYPFSTSGPFVWGDESQWFADDYSFCRRLGGVILEPVEVAHMKVVGTLPDEETLRRLAANEPLDRDPRPSMTLEECRKRDEYWLTDVDPGSDPDLPSPVSDRDAQLPEWQQRARRAAAAMAAARTQTVVEPKAIVQQSAEALTSKGTRPKPQRGWRERQAAELAAKDAERSEHERAVPGEQSQPAPEDTTPVTAR
jgi:hypothetical protein